MNPNPLDRPVPLQVHANCPIQLFELDTGAFAPWRRWFAVTEFHGHPHKTSFYAEADEAHAAAVAFLDERRAEIGFEHAGAYAPPGTNVRDDDSINVTNDRGQTFLHHVLRYSNHPAVPLVVELLLAGGLDPHVADRYGIRAGDYAERRGDLQQSGIPERLRTDRRPPPPAPTRPRPKTT